MLMRGDIFAASHGGGSVADDRMSSFPPALLLLAGDVSCSAAVSGRGSAGAEHGSGPQPAVWRGAAVLRRRWPPSPCRGAAVDCVLLLGGVAGAVRGCDACRAVVSACNRRPPSSTSASTSGLSRPVLPRRLWRVVGWVGFLSDVIGGVEIALLEGYPASTLSHGVCVIVYV